MARPLGDQEAAYRLKARGQYGMSHQGRVPSARTMVVGDLNGANRSETGGGLHGRALVEPSRPVLW